MYRKDMTDITFHGGVKEIGGNKFLVDDGKTKIFMDFGMSFSAEGQYFSEFIKARKSNYLKDMFDLKLLPKIKGMYRQDYTEHIGFEKDEPKSIDAVLLTHAHVDHCAYIKYLRADIPIHCSLESKLIMQSFDDTGAGNEYLNLKESFKCHKGVQGKMVKTTKSVIPREFKIFDSNKKFNIDSITVNPLPVDHSISGVYGFILETSSGVIGNTADIRFHGRRAKDSEHFIDVCGDTSLDLLLCEGTRIDKSPKITEYDIEEKVKKTIDDTNDLIVCGYPIRDLDRFQSFYNSVKDTDRYMVIDLKQAYLLKLFHEAMPGLYPSPHDDKIKVYIHRGTWGLIDKDISHFTEKLLLADYGNWAREFLDYDNKIDYRDVSSEQNKYVLSLSDFKLQELIDIKPNEKSVYIRSSTEPFNDEMEIRDDRVKNWLANFGLLNSEKGWQQLHISGHGDGEAIKKILDGANAKQVIPIHTSPENEAYHQKWHSNVHLMEQNDTFTVNG